MGIEAPIGPTCIEAPLLIVPHRASRLWTHLDNTLLTCRRSDSGLWDKPLDDRVLPYLIRAGVYGAYRVGNIRIDHALITALVERWREETHSFHFPFGESTVTLQDMSVLYGLPIDGPPILAVDETRSVGEWQLLCTELLGEAPEERYFDSGRLLVSWLISHFKELPEQATEEQVQFYARAYILWLIGGALMPDKSQNKVRLMFLPLLRNFDDCGSLSWGSAVLATLYRNLCRASKPDAKEIAGHLVLLQVWAWERIPCIAPRRLPKPTEDSRAPIQVGDQQLPSGPWACRWRVRFGLDLVATHVVTIFRDQFDRLRDDEFIWQPYSLEVIDSLPNYCCTGRELWLTRSPLICFDIVEWHLPHRVVRQFGCRQEVPERINTGRKLHDIDRRGRQNANWPHIHAAYRDMWMARWDNIVPAERTDQAMEYGDPYMQWFRRVSHLFVGNPAHRAPTGYHGAGGSLELLTRVVAEGYGQADAVMRTGDGEAALQALVQLRGIFYDTLRIIEVQDQVPVAHEGQALHLEPTPLQPPSPVQSPSAFRPSTLQISEVQDQVPVAHEGHALHLEPTPVQPPSPVQSPSASRPSTLTAPPGFPAHHPSDPCNSHLAIIIHPSIAQSTTGPDSSVRVPLTTQASSAGDTPIIQIATVLQEVPITQPASVAHLTTTSVPPPASFVSLTSSDKPTQNPSPHDPPHMPISWPSKGRLTREWMMDLMHGFDWCSRNLPPSEFPTLLPVDVFDSLIVYASKILHKEPNCVKVDSCGADSSVVVVGDLHGQLHDVIVLLEEVGFPADNRFFVFNGNYVDRGAWGLETFLLLLAWKVYMPDRVYLLRGNHESKYCTSVYGFQKEVHTKYGESGRDVYRKCLECFETLPLASVIAGSVYTAHGGLFRSITTIPAKRTKGKRRKINRNPEDNSLALGSLEELSEARRFVLNPPHKGSNLIPGDVLWSDPSMSPGLSPNKGRGLGLFWGADCTEEFLRKCNLKLIIRSREGPDARKKRSGLPGMDEGYSIDHDVKSGKLITLFSAPDYPQFQATEERFGNKGAYIVLEPPHFDTPVFCNFGAITPKPDVMPYYDYEHVKDSDEELDLNLDSDDELD